MKLFRSLTMAIALTAAFASKAQEMPDTLIVVEHPHSVTVTESSCGNSIVILGQDNDDSFYYSYSTEVQDSTPILNREIADSGWGLSLPFLKEDSRKHKPSKILWFNQVYIGIANPADGPRGIDRSIEVGVGQAIGFSYQWSRRSPILALGVGIHYQQYSLHRGQIFDREGRALTISPLEEGCSDASSKLRNFGIQIPLTITQKISGNFGIAVGAAFKLNTFTKATSKFKSGDTTYTKDFKGLSQRPVGFDLYGAIGWADDFGLYVRYTPTRLFDRSMGPDLTTLSFGITIGL